MSVSTCVHGCVHDTVYAHVYELVSEELNEDVECLKVTLHRCSGSYLYLRWLGAS